MKDRCLSAVHQGNRRFAAAGIRSCLAVSFTLLALATAAAQMPAVPVEVAPVVQRTLSTGETFVGTVMPLRSSTVGSPVEGRVMQLLVDEGDAVEYRAPLVELRTRQLVIRLDAAKAQSTLHRQELAELEDKLPQEVEQARARMMGAKALADFAASQLERAKSLYARKALSQDQLQEKESESVAAREKYLESVAAWRQCVKTSPARIEQAKAQLGVQKEEVARLEDEIAEHTITAPFDGYVTKEHTEVGQWIAKGGPVVDVVEVSQVDIEVPVLEEYISRVKVGDKTRVTFGALPGKAFDAVVALIVQQADVRSRSFPVKVRLKNVTGPGGVLFKPGMFARVTLAVGEHADALMVPKDAVVLEIASPVVYVVVPAPGNPGTPGPPADGVARRVPVRLGSSVEDLIEVRGPLKRGEKVVVEGNERLHPGMAVKIVNR